METLLKEHIEKDTKIESKLNVIIDQNREQNIKISDIHKTIHGNGNPDNGLVVKHAKLGERISAISTQMKLHWGIFLMLIGVIVKIAFF